jgi:hypothetical protein
VPETPEPPCAGLTKLFFGPDLDGRKERARIDRERECKEICKHCPFRIQCLERALVLEEPKGVWGGMTEGERRKFRRWLKGRYGPVFIPTGNILRREVRNFEGHSK